MATRAQIRAAKPPFFKTTKVKATTISTETHRQVFARLSDLIFNTGAMHGTPGQKKGKS